MALGENLKRLRREKGLTLHELSAKSGIKMTHIATLEKNKSDPKLSTIYKLLEALGCSADALLMDQEKIGMDGLLKSCLERTQELPPRAKVALVDVIDHYCIAYGMKKIFNGKNEIRPVIGMTTSLIEELPDISKLEG